jgi:hypothetical protein
MTFSNNLLNGRPDAERQSMHYHGDRGNEKTSLLKIDN